MSDNPLNRYFRRPALWLRLPSGGRWYGGGDVKVNEHGEIRIFGLTAVDDVMLNTPDALFNGHALESVLSSCVPDAHNIKALVQPDLNAIFLGIKSASNNGKFDIDRKCPKCNHDNSFDVQCSHLLDSMTYIEDGDTAVNVNDQLTVHIRPYDFRMRNIMIQRQFEQTRVVNELAKEGDDGDEMRRASVIAEGVEKMTRLTFELVAQAITKIDIEDGQRISVGNQDHINEWLVNVDKLTALSVIEAVNRLNEVGPPRSMPIQCQGCGHGWEEQVNFDPALFFTQP